MGQVESCSSRTHSFEPVSSVRGEVSAQLFRSKRSGLSVGLVESPGPMTHCYVSIGVEPTNNSGAALALEHLIPYGSKSYPYKDVLNTLAPQVAVQPLVSWTDVDHTCYSLSGAGGEGIVSLLPVLMDHICNPVLSEESFLLEVHHIKGDGTDGGAVYNRVKDHQANPHVITSRAALLLLYPGQGCGYRYDTSGLLNELEGLKLADVVEFHRKAYRADNIFITVVGSVDFVRFFDVLHEIDQGLPPLNTLPPLKKPWSAPVAPLKETQSNAVLIPAYSEEEMDDGMVVIGWRGCPWASLEERMAREILWAYLTEGKRSLLAREIEDRRLGADVCVVTSENSETVDLLYVLHVPSASLDEVERSVFEILIDHWKSGLNMQKISEVIRKKRIRHMRAAENNPASTHAFTFIAYSLYGKKKTDLTRQFESLSLLAALAKKDVAYWAGILSKIIDADYVAVVGQPSRDLVDRVAEREGTRREMVRTELGPSGLMAHANSIKRAEGICLTASVMPESARQCFSPPSVTSIPQFEIETFQSDESFFSDDRGVVAIGDWTSADLFRDSPGMKSANSTRSTPGRTSAGSRGDTVTLQQYLTECCDELVSYMKDNQLIDSTPGRLMKKGSFIADSYTDGLPGTPPSQLISSPLQRHGSQRLTTEMLLKEAKKEQKEKKKAKQGDPQSQSALLKLPLRNSKDMTPSYLKIDDATETRQTPSRSQQALLASSDKSKLGLRVPVQFDSYPGSKFVHLHIALDTSAVPAALRKYLVLYTELFFECPIKHESRLYSLKEIQEARDKDLVDFSNGIGFGYNTFVCGTFAQMVLIELVFEKNDYASGVQWAGNLLWRSQYIEERIRVMATKLINTASSQRFDSTVMAHSCIKEQLFGARGVSNHHAVNFSRQQRALKNMLRRLEHDPTAVCKDVERLRRTVADPRYMTIQVVGDILTIPNPLAPWADSFVPAERENIVGNLGSDSLCTGLPAMSNMYLKPDAAGKGHILSIPGATDYSDYFIVSGRGVPSYEDPEYTYLLVLFEYLCSHGGPLQQLLAATGLAHHYSIVIRPEHGQIYLTIARSNNITEAINVVKGVLTDLDSGKMEFEAAKMKSAIGSAMLNFVIRHRNAAQSAFQRFVNVFKHCRLDNFERVLNDIQLVSAPNLKSVLRKFMLPLFKPETSVVSLVVNPRTIEDNMRGLTSLGMKLQYSSTLEEVFPLHPDEEMS